MAKQAKRFLDLNVQGDLVSTYPLSFRNRIINGDCSVAQRGNVAVSSNTTAYGGCDRIAIQTSGFTTVSGTIAQAGTIGSGTSSSGYVQQFGGVTTTGSGTIAFIQRIEAINCADLNSKTVTISLTLYQDTGSTLSPTINLYKPNALDNWSASTFLQGTAVSLPTTSRTRFTFTATLGATDASNGLAVQVVFPVGAVSSKFFQISDIQLELGSSATPFERRPIGTELSLCQRYYELGTAMLNTSAPGATSIYVSNQANFKVTKRAIPGALTVQDLAGNAGKYSTYTPGSDVVTNNVNTAIILTLDVQTARIRITWQPGSADYLNAFVTWTASSEL
jgi:hypothetical protein